MNANIQNEKLPIIKQKTGRIINSTQGNPCKMHATKIEFNKLQKSVTNKNRHQQGINRFSSTPTIHPLTGANQEISALSVANIQRALFPYINTGMHIGSFRARNTKSSSLHSRLGDESIHQKTKVEPGVTNQNNAHKSHRNHNSLERLLFR